MPENSLIYIRPALAFATALAVLLVVRRVLLCWLARRTAVVVGSVGIPLILVAVALSLLFALRYGQLAADERKLARDYGERHEALGVGGLAVALALQDTLANSFTGIHILVEEPISVGDFIRWSCHEEGVVTDIGWRTPDQAYSVQIAILVGHTADPGLVARIAIEEAHAVSGVLPGPAPALSFDAGVTLSQIRVASLRPFGREGVPLPDIRRVEMPGA